MVCHLLEVGDSVGSQEHQKSHHWRSAVVGGEHVCNRTTSTCNRVTDSNGIQETPMEIGCLMSSIQANYETVHRDQIIDVDMVYNEYKKIEERMYKTHDDQAESIRVWICELEGAQFSTFFCTSFENDFTFGFMSPWQKNLPTQSRFVCLDATHKTANLPRCLLYTIVVRHPITGTGCPVAYMFTTNNGASSVVILLMFLRANGVTNLQKITTDVSNVELDAIRTVYPEVQVQ
jgi:hypothetical protein